MVENIKYNSTEAIMFPLKDLDGNLEYLGETYSLKEINIFE